MPAIQWNANLYDTKHDFVSQYGEDVLGWLQPQKDERILDLGCGTGQLAYAISEYGAEVVGIDNSPEMIARAKQAYPSVQFEIKDATGFSFQQPFDAVFSNATLHWIQEQQQTLKCVYNSLKPGGRFVLEMGARHNVESICNAIVQAMDEEGLADLLSADFWFFPSVSEYTALLEQQGFTVASVINFKRETALKGEEGMRNWITMFGSFFFKHITTEQAEKVTARAVELLRPQHYWEDTWYADYVRLRIKAVKN
ncbi:MAG: class I SAM-dependent methyltransferase [Chitinophagaceae bacterium]